MTSSPPEVLSERDGALQLITLNRPQRLNAINHGLLQALLAALSAAQADPQVRVIVLRGAGRSFCAGDDLVAQVQQGALEPDFVAGFVEALQQVTRLIMFGDKPVLALVQGWAIGGGFSWTLNADLCLWAESARALLPELGFGMFVSGGLSLLLPRAAGPSHARALVMQGEAVDARQLQAMGIAWRVVADAELQAQGLALARQIAELPPRAAQAFKRAMGAPERAALERALADEAAACREGASDPDTLQRIQRFLRERA